MHEHVRENKKCNNVPKLTQYVYYILDKKENSSSKFEHGIRHFRVTHRMLFAYAIWRNLQSLRLV